MRYFLGALDDAYKAPREVDEEVLEDLRRQYRGPSDDREERIFRDIRRLYVLTPSSEEAIRAELKWAYQLKTFDQEVRLFREIHKNPRVPAGTIPDVTQEALAARMFSRHDRDGSKLITEEEVPELMRGQSGRWDRNLDGAIALDEYVPYYRETLKAVAQKVASGAIYLRSAQPQSQTSSTPQPAPMTPAPPMEEKRPVIARSGQLPEGLPEWFVKYDLDEDGQVGLYEWIKVGELVDDFQNLDHNDDGLLEAAEVLRFLAEQAKNSTGVSPR